MDQQLVTQAEYARHRNVTRQAVGKAIAAKRIPTHLRHGKKLIDPAEADLALGLNVARLNEPPPPAPTEPESQSAGLTAARTQTEQYRARLVELQFKQKVGELLPRDGVVRAAEQCAETLIRGLDQLKSRAEELHAIALAEGVTGVRIRLNSIIRELRKQGADAFAKLATEAIAAGAAAADQVQEELETE